MLSGQDGSYMYLGLCANEIRCWMEIIGRPDPPPINHAI